MAGGHKDSKIILREVDGFPDGLYYCENCDPFGWQGCNCQCVKKDPNDPSTGCQCTFGLDPRGHLAPEEQARINRKMIR